MTKAKLNYAKKKALLLSDGAAGDAARSKLKVKNAKQNAKRNAKLSDRARAMTEARMLANPLMAIQILPVQAVSNQGHDLHLAVEQGSQGRGFSLAH